MKIIYYHKYTLVDILKVFFTIPMIPFLILGTLMEKYEGEIDEKKKKG